MQSRFCTLARLLEKLSDTSRVIVQAKFGIGPYEKPLSAGEIAKIVGCSRAEAYRRLETILHHRLRRLAEDDEADAGN